MSSQDSEALYDTQIIDPSPSKVTKGTTTVAVDTDDIRNIDAMRRQDSEALYDSNMIMKQPETKTSGITIETQTRNMESGSV